MPQDETKALKRNDSGWEETLPSTEGFSPHYVGGKAFALDACKERKARFHTEKLSFHNLLSHVDASGEGPRSTATKQNVFLENALTVTK